MNKIFWLTTLNLGAITAISWVTWTIMFKGAILLKEPIFPIILTESILMSILTASNILYILHELNKLKKQKTN